MLKTRLLTAITLGLLLVSIILLGPAWLFTLFLAVCIFTGAREWAGLSGVRQNTAGILYAAVITAAMLLLVWFVATDILQLLLVAGILWWCLAVVIIFAYQQGRSLAVTHPAGKLAIGALVLLPASTGLLLLYQGSLGRELLLVFFLLIWLVDSAAYFVGRLFGRHRLASRVSPGKSREGVAGSILAALVMAVVYTFLMDRPFPLLPLISIFLLATLFSVAGDLLESVFKREAGVKDSGRLLPGHGGVLDRIDSITAAAPFFVLGMSILGGRA